MERQFEELVTTVTVASRIDAARGTPPEPLLVPGNARGRLACESLLGLSVGDALGAKLEGAPFDAGRLDGSFAPDGLSRWTDDTQMALGIVETLLAAGTMEQDLLATTFGRRFESWRGYGPGMHVVLPRLRSGESWTGLREAVFPRGSFGNGSAMRVAPLGAYFHDAPVDTVVVEAERSAEVTHAHEEALTGAAAVAVAAWLAARSRSRPAPTFDELFSATRAPLDPASRVSRRVDAARELGASASLDVAVAELGNGSKLSCADTVPLALWIAFRHLDDFPTATLHAMAAGGDTDTVAAGVGGVVAARVGIDGIPEEWREAVEPIPVSIGGTPGRPRLVPPRRGAEK